MHEEKGTVVMYAIIQQGTKQFEVTKGQTYKVDKLVGNEGDEVTFKEVLLVVDGKKRHIGTPFVKKAQVTAKIIKDVKGKKVISFKFKRRKKSRRIRGHRQKYTEVTITDIAV